MTAIDRHLACDGREHAIRLLDELSADQQPPWPLVDVPWTPAQKADLSEDHGILA